MEDDDLSEYLLRKARECKSRAATALTQEERERWLEMCDYFADIAKRWAIPLGKKT